MKGVSHVLVGLFGAAATHILVAPLAPNLVGLVPVAAAAAVGALLPDIDSDESTIRQATGTARSKGCLGWGVSLILKVFGGHRAITHSLLAWALLSLVAGVYFRGSMLFVAFGVGYLSHLFADALTVQGVPLLWPVIGKRICFLPASVAIRTGGTLETLVVIAIGTAVTLLWLRA